MPVSEIVSYTLYPGEKRRRGELSICNVLFCLLVMGIHILAEAVDGYDRDSFPYFVAVGLWRLSSFVVQGYFFLGGVKLFLDGKNAPVSRVYVQRLRRVVLPYVLVFCLYVGYFALLGSTYTPLSLLRLLCTGKLCGHFYFVILMVQFDLLYPLWRMLVQKTNPILGCFTGLLVMLLCKEYLPGVITLCTGVPFADNGLLFTSFIFYYLAGAYCGRYYSYFRQLLDTHRRSLTIGWAFLAIVNWLFIWWNGRGVYYAPWLETFHVLYCCYAILTCLSWAWHYRHAPLFETKCFQKADRLSYYIYLLHPLLIFLCGNLMTLCGITSLTLRLLVRAIVVYGTTIVALKLAKKR